MDEKGGRRRKLHHLGLYNLGHLVADKKSGGLEGSLTKHDGDII